ncbi:MAG: SH3 domain-containing protein [Clostridiales bacterium]|nr:SH3 domain-containing protein [Clostridiales bacterium]
MFAICNLSVIPMRSEPSDRSEIVSQVLFGEHFEILEQDKQWSKIKIHFGDKIHGQVGIVSCCFDGQPVFRLKLFVKFRILFLNFFHCFLKIILSITEVVYTFNCFF